jgi:hypothetical protein
MHAMCHGGIVKGVEGVEMDWPGNFRRIVNFADRPNQAAAAQHNQSGFAWRLLLVRTGNASLLATARTAKRRAARNPQP